MPDIKPFWVTRLFIFMIPILFIAVIVSSRTGGKFIMASYVSLIFLVVSNVFHVFSQDSQQDLSYRKMVDQINRITVEKDCIAIHNSLDTFWGYSIYKGGVNWGSALQTQAPPDKRWATVVDKLPVDVALALQLKPRETSIILGSIFIEPGVLRPDNSPFECKNKYLIMETDMALNDLDKERVSIIISGLNGAPSYSLFKINI